MITGKYFTSDFVDPVQYKSMLHLIFMPLAFATKDMVDFMKKHDITMIYAEMRNALPRSINRYPCFIDASMVPREIHKKILALYHEKEKVLFPNGRPKS